MEERNFDTNETIGLDIDLILCIESCPIHIATNGVNLGFNFNFDENQSRIDILQDIFFEEDIYVNYELINWVINTFGSIKTKRVQINAYKSSFVEFARKGYFSFDTIHFNNQTRNALVACPKRYLDEIRNGTINFYQLAFPSRKNEYRLGKNWELNICGGYSVKSNNSEDIIPIPMTSISYQNEIQAYFDNVIKK